MHSLHLQQLSSVADVCMMSVHLIALTLLSTFAPSRC